MLFLMAFEGSPIESFIPFFVGLDPFMSILLVLAVVIVAAWLLIYQARQPLEYDPAAGHGHGGHDEAHGADAHGEPGEAGEHAPAAHH